MTPPVLSSPAPGRFAASTPLSADAALALVGERGLRLIEADPAAGRTANLLLVAMRREHHDRQFEPDWLLYWVAAAGRGVRRRLDRSSLEITGAPFAWGTIRVFDRLSVFNTYVTFGGTITLMGGLDTGTMVNGTHGTVTNGSGATITVTSGNFYGDIVNNHGTFTINGGHVTCDVWNGPAPTITGYGSWHANTWNP